MKQSPLQCPKDGANGLPLLETPHAPTPAEDADSEPGTRGLQGSSGYLPPASFPASSPPGDSFFLNKAGPIFTPSTSFKAQLIAASSQSRPQMPEGE